ncbi:Uncharacterized protein BP5553_01834 [Venustampulla echinocandica]|uniref:Sulfite efflux pump SSU1 n=1 Tax=Venustampulla echinocandica TaxID=2656787 RepID=A0A370U275_9HELO|nr:Uncharacterized protein BP5553_01834 [Venustampulla echinocandica]RDL41855.1 Uncharacterized protein BP5553_01834 [Venustampulla echinocandica]
MSKKSFLVFLSARDIALAFIGVVPSSKSSLRDGTDLDSEANMQNYSANKSDQELNQQPQEPEESLGQCRQTEKEHGWRKVVRNFNPRWFTVNMGTGIVSIVLYNLPYNGRWLYWISVVIFCLNVALFVTFFLISVVHYTLYPWIWKEIIQQPGDSLFLGTFPMGLATIINMIVYVCVPAWGYRAVQLAWGLWWIDVALSLVCCLFVPFTMMYYYETSLSEMTADWIFPVVSTIVAAASGGVVAEVLPNPTHALWTVLASYVLWGTGVPLAMVVLVIYFQRLTAHNLPPREVIVSVFLPLGPLGQGGFGIMQLGKVAMDIFPKTSTLAPSTINPGEVLYVVGWLVATVLWGFGLVWLFFAVASLATERFRFPFGFGWWSFTFPLGVFTASTTQMGKELPSRFFNVFGTITAVSVTLLWILVSFHTIKNAASGELFIAPSSKNLKKKRKDVRATV